MSIDLGTINLATATVGQTGTIPLQQAGYVPATSASNEKAHVRVHNDSGCELRCLTEQEKHAFYIPAGAWPLIEVLPDETGIDYTVIGIIPNAQLSLLMATLYMPGESIDDPGSLGNSPVGIGGNVNTSSVQTLSNEGGARNLKIIDIGDLALADIIDFFTDHFSLGVDQGGVRHSVVAGSTTGNPGQFGQAGDIAEFLGQLLVDQIATTGPTAPPTGTGTTTIRELVIGPVKIVIVEQVNYQNTGAAFNMSLPTAFTNSCFFAAGNIGGIALVHNGVVRNDLQVVTVTKAGGGSTVAAESMIFDGNIGYVGLSAPAPFDAIQMNNNNVTVHYAQLFIVGV